MRLFPLIACGMALAAGAAAAQPPALAPTSPPAVTLPPLPSLPQATATVGEGGVITLVPDRQLTVTLDGAHKAKFEFETADKSINLPVSETPRAMDDNLDNFNAPFFPAIVPGKLILTLWYDAKKGSILFTQNGTNETLIYTAAILAKRPNGAIARALTTICSVGANTYAGQTWDDHLDAIQILEIKAAPRKGCYNARTGVFASPSGEVVPPVVKPKN
jgi:hypothetical protein